MSACRAASLPHALRAVLGAPRSCPPTPGSQPCSPRKRSCPTACLPAHGPEWGRTGTACPMLPAAPRCAPAFCSWLPVGEVLSSTDSCCQMCPCSAAGCPWMRSYPPQPAAPRCASSLPSWLSSDVSLPSTALCYYVSPLYTAGCLPSSCLPDVPLPSSAGCPLP